jgi:hypothetical protein
VTAGHPCTAQTDIPPALLLQALRLPAVRWADLTPRPLCVLEDHNLTTLHQAVICEQGRDQALWVYWNDHEPPADLALRTDCPATSPDGNGCCGYVGHPGRHTFQLTGLPGAG